MNNPSNRGAAILSAILLLTFGGMLALVLVYGVAAESQALANVLLGSLAAMCSQVVAFWFGSNSSSARKDSVIAQSLPADLAKSLLPPNAAVVPTAEAVAAVADAGKA